MSFIFRYIPYKTNKMIVLLYLLRSILNKQDILF